MVPISKSNLVVGQFQAISFFRVVFFTKAINSAPLLFFLVGVPNQNVGNKNSEKNCHTMEDLVDHPWTLLVHCPPVITFVQFWGSKLCKKEVESFNGFKMTGLCRI